MRQLLLVSLLLSVGARGAYVTGNIHDIIGTYSTPITPLFVPLATPLANGGSAVLDITRQATVDSSGDFTVFQVGGLYRADFGSYASILVLTPIGNTSTYDFSFVRALAQSLPAFLQTQSAMILRSQLGTNTPTEGQMIFATGDQYGWFNAPAGVGDTNGLIKLGDIPAQTNNLAWLTNSLIKLGDVPAQTNNIGWLTNGLIKLVDVPAQTNNIGWLTNGLIKLVDVPQQTNNIGWLTNGLLSVSSVGTAAYSNALAFIRTNETRAVVITNVGNTIAGDISGGTGLTSGQIPSLDTAKITTGTFDSARLGVLSNHTDVASGGTNPITGQILTWNGTKWGYSNAPSGGGGGTTPTFSSQFTTDGTTTNLATTANNQFNSLGLGQAASATSGRFDATAGYFQNLSVSNIGNATVGPGNTNVWGVWITNSGAIGPQIAVNTNGNVNINGANFAKVGTVTFPANLTTGNGYDILTTVGNFGGVNASVIRVSANGVVTISANDQSSFTALKFGAIGDNRTAIYTTNAVGFGLELKTANGTGYTNVQALGFSSTLSNASPVMTVTLPANDGSGATQWTNTFNASGIFAFQGATAATVFVGTTNIAQASWKQWPMGSAGLSAFVPLRYNGTVAITNSVQPTLVTFTVFP